MLWRRRGLLLTAIAAVLALLVLLAPVAEISESDSLFVSPDYRIRLDHGLVTLSQALDLPERNADDIRVRIWIQQLPSHEPYLVARAAADERRFGPTVLELPPADGTFHPIDLPLWRIGGAAYLRLHLEGHGVMVAITPDDRLAGGYLELNEVGRQHQDLALNITSWTGGLNHYLPLYQFADGKPGPLGWPRLVPLLMVGYLVVVGLVMLYSSSIARLITQTEDSDLEAATVAAPLPLLATPPGYLSRSDRG